MCVLCIVANDIDELKEKYLDKHVTRCFIVNDESVLVNGFISSVMGEFGEEIYIPCGLR